MYHYFMYEGWDSVWKSQPLTVGEVSGFHEDELPMPQMSLRKARSEPRLGGGPPYFPPSSSGPVPSLPTVGVKRRSWFLFAAKGILGAVLTVAAIAAGILAVVCAILMGIVALAVAAVVSATGWVVGTIIGYTGFGKDVLAGGPEP
jgi:hypothetical protein